MTMYAAVFRRLQQGRADAEALQAASGSVSPEAARSLVQDLRTKHGIKVDCIDGLYVMPPGQALRPNSGEAADDGTSALPRKRTWNGRPLRRGRY